MTVRLIRSPGLASAPYAYAAVVDRLVFTAGACPLNDHGVVVAPGDFTEQAHQVMRNLSVALADAGSGLQHIAKSTVYVASSSRTDLSAVWEVVRSYLGDHDAPSTLLGVAALGYENQLVEVEVVAVQSEAELTS